MFGNYPTQAVSCAQSFTHTSGFVTNSIVKGALRNFRQSRVTYLSYHGGGVAIWIVSEPREEHIRAVSWLNETAADFYLVQVEAIKIGTSPPALLLTKIVGPSEEAKEIGEDKREQAERHHIRKEFWAQLLERAKQRTPLHAAIAPTPDNWIAAGAGKGGLSYNYVILQHVAKVEFVFSSSDGAENRRMFDKLQSAKEAIEASFGQPLEWDALEGRKVCTIRLRLEDGGYRDRERWPEIQEAMIEAMIRLEKALRPYVTKL